MDHRYTIAVAGGGAAGFFGAITCAESIPDCKVVILEKSPEPLAKVTISGGGRCNVTNACFEPARLVQHYPRGHRELLGPFHRWQPRDTVKWFEDRGVPLKVEPDNRMFPVSDQSSSITECLIREAQQSGVKLLKNQGLVSITRKDRGFLLGLSSGASLNCERLLVATGGNQNSGVFKLVEQLGHTIKPLQPSLFSFDCQDSRLQALAGISVSDVQASIVGTTLKQRGPLLITHWGLSGPAILKLSAWGAPQLADVNYQFKVKICWVPDCPENELRDQINGFRTEFPKRTIHSWNNWNLPQRLWQSLISGLNIPPDTIWNQFPRQKVEPLIQLLLSTEFQIDGKSMNKDEFVTSGGVSLDEVDFKTMQSRKCAGLYFAGEILDIDGVTGGFNFQSAWTTGWIAGKSIGQEI